MTLMTQAMTKLIRSGDDDDDSSCLIDEAFIMKLSCVGEFWIYNKPLHCHVYSTVVPPPSHHGHRGGHIGRSGFAGCKSRLNYIVQLFLAVSTPRLKLPLQYRRPWGRSKVLHAQDAR